MSLSGSMPTFAAGDSSGSGFVTAAGRVVYVVDEPDRYGFAMAHCHPILSRERKSFTVVRDRDRIGIRDRSRSRCLDTRWLASVLQWLAVFQVRVTRSYLRAMRTDHCVAVSFDDSLLNEAPSRDPLPDIGGSHDAREWNVRAWGS